MNETLLRSLTPSVLGILGRRGADFAAAEDAVQDALVEAVRVWPDDPPRDAKSWLVTVAWRRFLDATRADVARRRRPHHPPDRPGLSGARGDHGAEDQPGQAHRLRRAVRPARRHRHRAACPLPGLQRGLPRRLDLAAEAIRLARRLAASIDHPEVAGLLALMLLHHARRAARTAPDGGLVPLAEQDRGRWDTESITEGVRILQAALARDRLGEFQAQAAIAALHADAPTAGETGWAQIVEWYDELARLTDSPVVRLNARLRR